MKYLKNEIIDLMVSYCNQYLTPEIKKDLIDLHQKYGIWFIQDKKGNNKLMNDIVVSYIRNQDDYYSQEWNNENLPVDERQQIWKQIRFKFSDDYKKIERFNIPHLRQELRKITNDNGYLDTYIDPIILIKEDARTYLNELFSITNVPQEQLKITRQISETFNKIFDLIGEFDAIRLIQTYGSEKNINRLHNTIF